MYYASRKSGLFRLRPVADGWTLVSSTHIWRSLSEIQLNPTKLLKISGASQSNNTRILTASYLEPLISAGVLKGKCLIKDIMKWGMRVWPLGMENKLIWMQEIWRTEQSVSNPAGKQSCRMPWAGITFGPSRCWDTALGHSKNPGICSLADCAPPALCVEPFSIGWCWVQTWLISSVLIGELLSPPARALSLVKDNVEERDLHPEQAFVLAMG